MYLGKGSKAVGGAAGIGDNVNVRIVLCLIHTDNKHWRILAGCGDDNLLGSTLYTTATTKPLIPNKIKDQSMTFTSFHFLVNSAFEMHFKTQKVTYL
jgi:F0F1-type ATP synthase beta subunit